MTTQDVNSEGFPQGGEFTEEAITLNSRYPLIPMPQDIMWPMKLHDSIILETATEALPELVQTLSEPIQPATQEQIHGVFAQNPHQRRLPWVFKNGEDGTYSYSTGAYDGETVDGRTPLFDGIKYTFDANGRATKYEVIEGARSYNAHRPRYQEFFTYDDDGYLVQRSTWDYLGQPFTTDRFDYGIGDDGRKVATTMTRTTKVATDSFERKDSDPMTVDLANHEEWLRNNPNGFTARTKDELEPQELQINDFNVSEHRSGILFSHPELLETALVMYGDGSYPTPGGETALEYNDKAFAESSALGGALFSLMARSGDMLEFVQTRIMEQVQDKWKAVQRSRKPDASETVHFSFDYDGAGHFHKTHGEVAITKDGLVLTFGAAYVGNRVEDDLASALGQKRGLRSTTIEVPVNQTEHDGYFLIDVKAVADKLGVPVSDEVVSQYLREYLGEDTETPRSRYDKKYGKKTPLFEDAATGVRVDLVTDAHDYDTDTDLDDYFGHDSTSVWGPLPKSIRYSEARKESIPKLRIIVEPAGNPFDEETAQRTDEIVRGYMSKL